MAGEELIIYWLGAAIFMVATIIFLALSIQKNKNKFLSTSDIFVSFLTVISYIIMALAFATVTSGIGEPIYWSRWVFYMASCSILTVDVALINKKTDYIDLFKVVLLTSLVMFCGFLASYITGIERWLFFGLSSAAFAGLLYTLFVGSNKQKSSLTKIVMWWVFIFWSLFPVVWILAPTGFGLFSTFIESILYLVLDIITKIAFGFYITSSFKTDIKNKPK